MSRRRLLPIFVVGIVAAASCLAKKQDTGAGSGVVPEPDPFGFWEPPVADVPIGEPTPLELDARIRDFYDAVAEAGGQIYLAVEERDDTTRTLKVRVPIRRDSVVVDGDMEYADIDLGAFTVRVTKSHAAPARQENLPAGQLQPRRVPPPGAQPSGRTVNSGHRVVAVQLPATPPVLRIPDGTTGSLESFFLLKSYELTRAPGAPATVRLMGVAVLKVRDPLAGAVVTQAMDTALSSGQDCDADTFVATPDLPSDMDIPVPQISSCDPDECKLVNAAWWRAYHDVEVVLQMLQQFPWHSEEEQEKIWGQNWVDANGAPVEETSLEYWFGPFQQRRLEAITYAYSHLFNELQDPKQWMLTCRGAEEGKCDSSMSPPPAAYHMPQGSIGVCTDVLFAPPASPVAEATSEFNHVRIMVHEALHWDSVPLKGYSMTSEMVVFEDEHRHKHGPNCGQLTRVSDTGYRKVRHLARYPMPAFVDEEEDSGCSGCSGCNGCTACGPCAHGDIAAVNPDTYALAAASIGSGIRLHGAVEWPVLELSTDAGVDCLPPPLSDSLAGCDFEADCTPTPVSNISSFCSDT